ncbi:MAG: DUF116 domain-containing protein [Nitrospirales bacterium]|nr:DUF116 domain-containing protein [Nitrospirales bacterium]
MSFLRGLLLKGLYPVLMFAGAFFKDRKEGFQRLVVRLNNRLVMSEGIRTKRILILLPHCLQIHDCDVRITNDIHNCKRCGRCGIRDLITIADDNSLRLFIASGGTLARRIIKEIRPEAIVAVACERDLSSGIADSYPLPVLGVPNERPFGPCRNTRVPLDKVREAVEFLGRDA